MTVERKIVHIAGPTGNIVLADDGSWWMWDGGWSRMARESLPPREVVTPDFYQNATHPDWPAPGVPGGPLSDVRPDSIRFATGAPSENVRTLPSIDRPEEEVVKIKRGPGRPRKARP